MRQLKRGVLPLATGLLVFTGCSSSRDISEPRLPEWPASFSVSFDSSRSVKLTKQLAFQDTVLVALIDLALRQNPDVLIASERIEMARAQLRYRKGRMLPVVEADATAGGTKYGDYTMEGVGNFDTNLSPNINEDQKTPMPFTPNYFLGFRSNWEIDLWGKLRQRKKAARLRLLASEAGRKLVITTLVSEVASRYYELQALDAELEVIRRNIALQDSAVYIAQIQKEAGRTTELGVQQFRAQLLRTQMMQANTEQEITRVENELNSLLGRFKEPVKRTALNQQRLMPLPRIGGSPYEVLSARPDVVQAERLLEAQGADLEAARKELFPSLTLTPFAGFNSFNSALLFDPASLAYGIVGGLTAPLLNRTAAKAGIQLAEAEQREALHQYSRTVFEAYREVETTMSSIRNIRSVYELNRQEVDVLRAAVATANELYKAGYANYLEVISAQQRAIEAEISLAETRKALHFAQINLYRAIGGGW